MKVTQLRMIVLFALAVLGAVLLSACNFSLAEDIQPPANYQPPVVQSQPTPVTGSLFPLVPADIDRGQALYAEKCAPCHGEQGRGDGPQAADLPNPVTAIGDPEVARQSALEDWYQMVSEGNLDRFMPPFKGSLSVNERWDVLAYVYSLSTPPEALEQGQALYQENCVECHGENGAGDGVNAAALQSDPTALASPKFLASQTSQGLFTVISDGTQEMPAFKDTLTEAERWTLSDYLISLTFEAPGVPVAQNQEVQTTPAVETPGDTGEIQATSPVSETAGTAEAPSSSTQADNLGAVRGVITNASGGSLEEGMEVTLHAFDSMDMAFTLTTTVQTGGEYLFEDLEMPAGRLFLTTTDFMGATYASEVVSAEEPGSELELPITVYATSTDPSVLSIDRLHLFFEFADENTLRVIELFIISNLGDSTLVAPAEGEPVVTFDLPEGATNLEFQEGQLGDRFLLTEDGFGDTMPIQPGVGVYQVLLAFEMPFDRELEMVQEMKQPTNAVVILVPEGMVKVEGENLADGGSRPVEDVTYHTYNASSIRAGEELRLTIRGGSAVGGAIINLGDNSTLLIGLAVFGLALVSAGVYLFIRNRKQEEDEEEETYPVVEGDVADDPETLMDAILALDDQYQSGELSEEAYRQRRAELKARLNALMS